MWPIGMKPGLCLKGHSKTGGVTILLSNIGLLVPLYEKEYKANCQDQYSCSCHDAGKFSSHTQYTIISKTNCPIKSSRFFDY